MGTLSITWRNAAITLIGGRAGQLWGSGIVNFYGTSNGASPRALSTQLEERFAPLRWSPTGANALTRFTRDRPGTIFDGQLLRLKVQRTFVRNHKRSHCHRGAAGEQPSAPFAYNFARSMLITSSEVITPVSLLCSSTTGIISRLYLSNNSATSFSPRPS